MHHLVRLHPCPRAEQGHGVGIGKGRDRELNLTADPEPLAAGDQQPQVVASLDQRGQLRRCSMTCSRLSSTRSISRSPMCSATPSWRPRPGRSSR